MHLINKKELQKYNSEITFLNQKTVFFASSSGMIVFGALCLLALPPFKLFRLTPAYIGLFVIASITFVFAKNILPKHPRLTLPILYGEAIFILLTTLLMGTYMQRNANAVTFIVMLVIVPMLIIDHPLRLQSVILIICFIFGTFSLTFKDFTFARMDLLNCLIFYVVGFILGQEVSNIKVLDIITQKALDDLANYDPLTKLKNRRSIEYLVNSYLNQSNAKAAMILGDVDNFKQINDQLGHLIGDEVLFQISTILTKHFKTNDILSRIGGDEYMIFVEDIKDINEVCQIMQAVIDEINNLVFEQINIKMSFGIVECPLKNKDFNDLYSLSDEALYQAKKEGKNKYHLYHEK